MHVTFNLDAFPSEKQKTVKLERKSPNSHEPWQAYQSPVASLRAWRSSPSRRRLLSCNTGWHYCKIRQKARSKKQNGGEEERTLISRKEWRLRTWKKGATEGRSPLDLPKSSLSHQIPVASTTSTYLILLPSSRIWKGCFFCWRWNPRIGFLNKKNPIPNSWPLPPSPPLIRTKIADTNPQKSCKRFIISTRLLVGNSVLALSSV